MKILDKITTERLLRKLLKKLGNSEPDKRIYNFMGQKSWRLWKIIGNPKSSLHTLWFPQKTGDKYIEDVYQSNLQFCNNYPTEKQDYSFYEQLVPSIGHFLEKEGIEKIFCLAEWGGWDEWDKIGKALELKPTEIEGIASKFTLEGYIFPEDNSWLFCITHENFSFLAGTDHFINRYKMFFPDYVKFNQEFDMLIKPNPDSSHPSGPNC